MSEGLRVERISGISYTKDSTYYSSRGQHDSSSYTGQNFSELLRKNRDKSKKQEEKPDQAIKRDTVVLQYDSLQYNEEMRKIADSIGESEKAEEQKNVDPRMKKALQAYAQNQTMMTRADLFKTGLKVSDKKVTYGEDGQTKSSVNIKESDENER